MRAKPRIKLRTKLIAAYLVPVLILLTAAGGLAFRAARRALEDQLGRRLAGIAQAIAGHYALNPRDAGRLDRLDFDPESAVRRRQNGLLEVMREVTEVRRVFVFRPDLVALLDTEETVVPGTELFGLEQDRAELARISQGLAQSASSILFTGKDGSRYMNGYAPIRLDGEIIAFVGVEGSAAFFDTLDNLRTALGIVGLLMAGIVVLISLFVSHRLTRPIDQLVDALGRYGRGELKEPHPVQTQDEIGYLARAFNQMRESLDRRDEQMQLMLSGIAHEVRNPLAGMALFCDLLKDELEDEPEQRESVEKIERELDYLARVVNDFLNYARKRPMSPERFPANALMAELVDGASGPAKDRGVDVIVEVEAGLELTGERKAVRGVVANLLQNAIQACGEGGRVTLSARADDGWRRIEVADDGCGMDEDTRSKIFEPFFTTRQQGTGLGLALVHKAIREHGGEIEVESAPGEGTRFLVQLPFDEGLKSIVHEPDYEGYDDDEMIG